MWLQEWKKDVKALEAEVRAIKLKLRNDWSVSYTPGTYAGTDQFKLLALKFKLTHLYQYRAANRKKLHVDELPVKTWGMVLPDLGKYDELKKKSLVGAFKDVDATVLVSATPQEKPRGFVAALKSLFS